MRHRYSRHPQRALSLVEQLHTVDEWVPVEAVAFGWRALLAAPREFCARSA
jgi:hypothetical protein